MSWIDEVAFMSARRFSGRPFVVTASIDNITFLQPLRMGDHVILTSQVNYSGRTSMEIGVKVEREDAYTGERAQATSAYLTFVALDETGKPCLVPELLLETPEDHRRYEEALMRVKVRERVKAYLKRKIELRAQSSEGASETAAQTTQKRALFQQMSSHLQETFQRYQALSKAADLPLLPKDLRKFLRGSRV